MIPHSYHTFLLPFEYSGTILPDSGFCAEKTMTATAVSAGKKYVADYAMFQYFTPEARSLLFGAKHDYCYPPEKLENEVYIIEKHEGKGRPAKTFLLPVTRVRVLLQDNGVGLFMLSVENRDYPEINDIAWINEYGRRISLPYLTDAPHEVAAEKISLLGKTADFVKLSEEYISSGHTPNGDIIEPVRAVIEDLLGGKGEIKPIIDDRMFVCCLIRNEALSASFKDDGLYTSEEVYRLAFVDADDASCPSERMRREILERCIYDRWATWGTVDVVTHHSIFRLTGEYEGIINSVINPFNEMYVQLAAGALLQRASIMYFSNKCAQLSRKINNALNSKKGITAQLKREIEKLNAEFADAGSCIFLDQLCAQEQGMEEFDMLRRELYIDTSLERLNEKVKGVYDLAHIYTEQEENNMLNFIAYLGIPLAAAELVRSVAQVAVPDAGAWWHVAWAIIGAAAGVAICTLAKPIIHNIKNRD